MAECECELEEVSVGIFGCVGRKRHMKESEHVSETKGERECKKRECEYYEGGNRGARCCERKRIKSKRKCKIRKEVVSVRE